MNTACPQCLSESALGNDAVAMCLECGAASAGTFSVSVPMMLAAAAVITISVLAFNSVRRLQATRALATA